MKTIVLFLIHVYQRVLSPQIKYILGVQTQCLYQPTCSTYAREAVIRYGVIKGFWLSLGRVLSCNQFTVKKAV